MPSDTPGKLQPFDIDTLTEVVRQDQRSPDFAISDWRVDHLSSKGIINPDGLLRVSGNGRDRQGTKAWSVVLKILRPPDEDQDLREIFYWKRELLAVQHGLLTQLPGPLAAPRVYGASEHSDSAWLWMEHIVDASRQRWGIDEFAFAARVLGLSNGRSLLTTNLPDYPWLCTEHCCWWLTMIEKLRPETAWENPFVCGAFSETARRRVAQLWADKDALLATLNHLPQVFSHFDPQRRNLFIRERDDHSRELVAVDWAFVGRDALGGDLAALVGASALVCEIEPEDVPTVEAAAMDAYLGGLHDAGWMGDADLVRLAYTAWFALLLGAALPAGTAARTSFPLDAIVQAFGRGPESLASTWARLGDLALDRADEARQLLARMRLANPQ